MDALCACQHRADEHDNLGRCHLCGCTDFRNDLTHLAFAVGVLVETPAPASNVVHLADRAPRAVGGVTR